VAALAGYDPQELEAVGPDAAAYSFGCGDPLALAGIEPGQTVVDLGCGAGLDLLLAARRVGPAGRVIGIDMTDEMLARARANIAAAGLGNVEVRKGLIEALPVETASVDWVISNCVINLSPQKRRVFAEIARVLRPGGRMLVSDIVVEDLPDWVRGDENLYNGCIGGAVSESDYLQGLRAAGLKDVGVVKRFVYDARQLQWMLGPGLHGRTCCGLGAGSAVDAGRVARDLAGRVWSAQFAAARA
jgi:SAM-dependent methyltransferase